MACFSSGVNRRAAPLFRSPRTSASFARLDSRGRLSLRNRLQRPIDGLLFLRRQPPRRALVQIA
jgi:hypothetical protein